MRFNYFKAAILLCISVLLFTSCTQKTSKEFWIDNPTTEQIEVKIDGTSYQIPPRSGINAVISYGKHQLAYDGETLSFFVKDTPTTAFINPTQSNYVQDKCVFIDKNDARATPEFMEWIIDVNSDSIQVEIEGEKIMLYMTCTVTNNIFIEKSMTDWNYFLDDKLPEEIVFSKDIVTRRNRQLANDENYKAGKFQDVKYKLYREQDFFDYLKETGVEEDIKFCLEKKKFSDFVPTKVKLTQIDAVSGDDYKEIVRNKETKFNTWLQSTDPAEVIEIQEELFSVKAITKEHKLKEEYGAKYDGEHNDNTQKIDYGLSAALNEFREQTSIYTRNSAMSIEILNFLIVE